MEMKRGFVFTMDVLIGLGLIILLFIFAFLEFGTILPEKRYQKLNFIAEDTMDLLEYLKVSDVQDKPIISQLIEDGIITERDMDKSVLDLIAGFWYKDNKTVAGNITKEVLGEIIDVVNIELSIDGQEIYSSSNAPAREVAVASRIESGYEPGQPVYGYIARAYLTRIRGKKDSSYVYFGGYVGEGNITRNITLPEFDKILEAYMEMNAGNNFTLYINGNFSGFYANGTAGGGYMRADKWIICNLTYNPHYCLNFTVGNNKLSFNFTGNRSFIGGGYFKVTYNTTQMAPEEEVGKQRYWFPGINGFLNLYDSFYVPGTLSSMKAYLHYLNNLTFNEKNGTTYFTIADKKVFKSNDTTEQSITLSYDDIWQKFGSEENFINNVSNKTVPIRFGTEEFEIYAGVGVADAILTTDVSGSMSTCDVNSPPPTNVTPDCNATAGVQNRRIDVAKYVDNVFVDTVLNVSGNRVGLTAYSSSPGIRWWHTLSNDSTSLKNQISSYSANGCTCISCGIQNATNTLVTQSNPSRFRGILVMSDGYANTIIPGTAGCAAGNLLPNCPDNEGYRSRAGREATLLACQARNLNLTTFGIAFGTGADREQLRRIACWNCTACPNVCMSPSPPRNSPCWIQNITLPNGSTAHCLDVRYAESNNIEELRKIYREFGEWFVKMGYAAQRLNITGNITFNNVLYPDSYVEFDYIPSTSYEYGEISLTRETARLKEMSGDSIDIPYKEGWFNVSDQVRVVDAKVTSYSSEYWTDRVWINSSNTPGYESVYWLGNYGSDYTILGDSYIVQIPVNKIAAGNNSIRIGTGMSPLSATGGSPDNKIIYTMRIRGSVPYGNVFNSSENATEDANQRLRNLVQNYVDFTSEDIRVENKTLRGVQSLWGPSLLKVVVWEKEVSLGFWEDPLPLAIVSILSVLSVIYLFKIFARRFIKNIKPHILI
jgi:hypothetical protein